jgi:hypothetical protein
VAPRIDPENDLLIELHRLQARRRDERVDLLRRDPDPLPPPEPVKVRTGQENDDAGDRHCDDRFDSPPRKRPLEARGMMF